MALQGEISRDRHCLSRKLRTAHGGSHTVKMKTQPCSPPESPERNLPMYACKRDRAQFEDAAGGGVAKSSGPREIGETPLTQWLRVLGEGDWGSRGMDYDVSWIGGEERTSGRTWTGIMWPLWQTGHFSQRAARESLVSIAIVLRCRSDRRTFTRSRHAENLAALLQLLLAMGIGEEPVVANAVEPAW